MKTSPAKQMEFPDEGLRPVAGDPGYVPSPVTFKKPEAAPQPPAQGKVGERCVTLQEVKGGRCRGKPTTSLRRGAGVTIVDAPDTYGCVRVRDGFGKEHRLPIAYLGGQRSQVRPEEPPPRRRARKEANP